MPSKDSIRKSPVKKGSTQARLNSLENSIACLLGRLQAVDDSIHEAIADGITDNEAIDFLDGVDSVILGFEEIVTDHLNDLRRTRDLLREKIVPHLEQRKQEVREWSFVKEHRDIPTGARADRRCLPGTEATRVVKYLYD